MVGALDMDAADHDFASAPEFTGIDKAFCAAITILAGLLAYIVNRYQLDIGPCDENTYALAGELWPNVHLLSNWGPLYSLWHSFLLTIVPDRITEYFLNFWILSTAFPPLFFVVMRKFGAERTLAVGFSIFFLSSFCNLYDCPRIQIFCFCFHLLALLAAYRCRDSLNRFTFLAASIWLSSYIRPEMAFSAILFVVVGVIRYRKELRGSFSFLPLVYLLLAILPILWFGLPMSNPRYDRSAEAFGQLYAKHLLGGEVPEVYTRWREFVERDYHTRPTLMQAFLSDPVRTVTAVTDNFQDLDSIGVAAFSGVGALTFRVSGLSLLVFFLCFSLVSSRSGTDSSKTISPEQLFLLCVLFGNFLALGAAILFPRRVFSLLVYSMLFLGTVNRRESFSNFLKLVTTPLTTAAAALILWGIAAAPFVAADTPNLARFRAMQRQATEDEGKPVCFGDLRALLTTDEYGRQEAVCGGGDPHTNN